MVIIMEMMMYGHLVSVPNPIKEIAETTNMIDPRMINMLGTTLKLVSMKSK